MGTLAFPGWAPRRVRATSVDRCGSGRALRSGTGPGRSGWANGSPAPVPRLLVGGAQDLVPAHDLVQGTGEDAAVEATGEAQGRVNDSVGS